MLGQKFRINELTIYKPIHTTYNKMVETRIRGNPSYIGYNGKEYMNIIISNRETSEYEEVQSGSDLEGILNKSFSYGVRFIIEDAVSTYSSGIFVVGYNLLEALDTSTASSYDYQVRVDETKYTKWTYIQIPEGWVFGARGEKAYFHFEHELKVDGNFEPVQETDGVFGKTDNYYNLDEKAYFSYPSGGWIEGICDYKFGNTTITSTNGN